MMKSKPVSLDFDPRMVEWNLKHGVITKDQLKDYLKSLPDESANAEELHIEDGHDDMADGSAN